jgi:hypothetical protein
MADGALDTTNILLGTLVLIGVLEAVALAVVVVVAMRLYAQLVRILRDVQQQVRPLAERVNDLAAVVESITTDVKSATARAAAGAEKAGAAFQTAVDVAKIVRGTAHASVVSRALPLIGIARGLRVAYRSLFADRSPTTSQTRSSRVRFSRDRNPDATPNHSHTVTDKTEATHGT